MVFSVSMGTNILNGTFTQGTDTVWVEGTFDGWSGGTQLAQEDKSTIYTNTVQDSKDVNGGHADYKFIIDLTGTATRETGFPGNSNGSDNRVVALPASSGATITPPTPFFNEAGHPKSEAAILSCQF